MEIDYPPYKITDKMLNYVSDIMLLLVQKILLSKQNYRIVQLEEF